MLRFGIGTTRYKDIFDIYYLINNTDISKDKLLNILNLLIVNDKAMRESNVSDIVKNLEITLNNNIFKRNLSDVRNNWLDVSVDEVISNVLYYFKSLETVEV